MDNLEDLIQEENEINTNGLTKLYSNRVMTEVEYDTELDYRKTYGEINITYGNKV